MEKQVTREELSRCDGQDGRPAYVAFQGKVYDLSGSKLWSGGLHQRRHRAGTDLTAEISAAPHGEGVFQRISPIGTLVTPGQKSLHPLLRLYLDLHPHPVSVHFPIALTLVSAGFLVCHLASGIIGLVDAAYYTLLTAAIMSPIAALVGASSWWFNYQHKLTPTYKGKASLSIVLFILQAVTLTIWATNRTALPEREAAGWLYFALVIIMSALVLGLGKLGGEIVFPSRRKTGNQG
ncbi:MAG: DUF2231 domain-containing protein [Chloroflexi bacterium]|nr:DUF2231 domain-containing protein [Chloroflexota bacterium]